MIVKHSYDFFNYFSKFNNIFSAPQFENILDIGGAVLNSDTSKNVSAMSRKTFREIHRSSLSRFLTVSPWDENRLNSQRALLSFAEVQREALETKTPIFLSIDDTLITKTCRRRKVEGLSKQYSHVTGKFEWGHSLVAMQAKAGNLSIPLNFELYNTSEYCEKEKIEFKPKTTIALNLLNSIPFHEEIPTYFLADSWFSSEKLINIALQKGIHSIMPIKSNRTIYPDGVGMSTKEFSFKFIDTDSLDFVTVKGSDYYVYRYEGNLNNIPNVVVLVSYKMVAGELANPLYILTTDIELSNNKIIEYYLNRWDIEVSFRYQKDSFGLKDSQMRSLKGMKRFWSIVYLVHNFVVLESFKVSQNTRKLALER